MSNNDFQTITTSPYPLHELRNYYAREEARKEARKSLKRTSAQGRVARKALAQQDREHTMAFASDPSTVK